MRGSIHHDGSGTIRSLLWGGLLALALTMLAVDAPAQNAAFQSFFTDVCTGPGTPSGALAVRCSETGGGSGDGDISGDSESSLNPSQALPMNGSALSRARGVANELKERMEGRRAELVQAPPSDAAEPQGREIAGAAATGSGLGSRWSLLANGRWQELDRDATSLERGWDGTQWSGQVGADYMLSQRAVLGGFFTYDSSDFEFERDTPAGSPFVAPPNAGDTESNSYSLTLFGSYNFTDQLWADGFVGGGYTDYEFTRSAVFQESGRSTQVPVSAKADTNGGDVRAGLGLGFDSAWKSLSGGPYVRFNYAWTRIDDYGERDPSGLAMHVDALEQDSLVSIVGLRGAYAISTRWGVVLPQARVEWEHEFLMDALTATTRYQQDASRVPYSLRGDDPDRNHGNVGAGVSMVLRGGWIPFVDYEALFGHSFLFRQRVTFGFRKEL